MSGNSPRHPTRARRAAAILLGLSFWTLILCGLSVWVPTRPAFAQDTDAYCSEAAANWLVLVDQTEPFTDANREDFQASMRVIVRQLQAGDRLIVQTVGARTTTTDVRFSQCLPACPSSSGIGAFIGTSCNRIRVHADREQFRRRLIGVIEDLSRGRQTDATALVTTLATINEHHSGRRFERVFLYSDLIEFEDGVASFYADFNPTELLRQVESRDLIPRLPGAVIDVFGTGQRLGVMGGDPYNDPLSRPSQRADIEDFWKRYFRVANGDGPVEFHEGALTSLTTASR